MAGFAADDVATAVPPVGSVEKDPADPSSTIRVLVGNLSPDTTPEQLDSLVNTVLDKPRFTKPDKCELLSKSGQALIHFDKNDGAATFFRQFCAKGTFRRHDEDTTTWRKKAAAFFRQFCEPDKSKQNPPLFARFDPEHFDTFDSRVLVMSIFLFVVNLTFVGTSPSNGEYAAVLVLLPVLVGSAFAFAHWLRWDPLRKKDRRLPLRAPLSCALLLTGLNWMNRGRLWLSTKTKLPVEYIKQTRRGGRKEPLGGRKWSVDRIWFSVGSVFGGFGVALMMWLSCLERRGNLLYFTLILAVAVTNALFTASALLIVNFVDVLHQGKSSRATPAPAMGRASPIKDKTG